MSQPENIPDKDRPVCVAIIICNEIIEDKRTNNKTLVSLFSSIAAPKYPVQHARMFLMASLTNGVGVVSVTFTIRSPQGVELVRFQGEATFHDPVAVVDIVVEVQGLVIPEPGVYYVEVLTGSYPLGHRRFTAQQVAPPPGLAVGPPNE